MIPAWTVLQQTNNHSRMRKLLIFIILPTNLILIGCSTVGEGAEKLSGISNIIPRTLDRASFIYRPTIQQGNVVTQEQMNRLKPGMSREQVRFILGSPTLRDVFHDNRWDYPYTISVGSTPKEIKHFAVLFENDRLTRIIGDYHPKVPDERIPDEKPRVVKVPDWKTERKSLLGRMADAVGLDDDG